MAKLDRVTAKVFADSAAATEIGQFGSAVAGSKLETADVATIQGLSAWLNGWSEALVSGNRYPTLQEMNGLLKVLSYQGAYALQEGIPEYDGATTYYIGSIVKKTGTFEIYGSLTDNNVGKALTVDTEWQFLCDLANISGGGIIPIGTCSTASATAEKAVVCEDFELAEGVTIQITFDEVNTATTPTLNINSTGAKALKNLYGDTLKYIPANIPLDFRYDGTNYVALYTNTFAGMPDYASVINKSTETVHQAECDGWLRVNGYIDSNSTFDIKTSVDGVNFPTNLIIASVTLTSAGGAYQLVPITKGMYYKATKSAGSISGFSLNFYPSKGVN